MYGDPAVLRKRPRLVGETSSMLCWSGLCRLTLGMVDACRSRLRFQSIGRHRRRHAFVRRHDRDGEEETRGEIPLLLSWA
jgi:hypothetical protein